MAESVDKTEDIGWLRVVRILDIGFRALCESPCKVLDNIFSGNGQIISRPYHEYLILNEET